jgi:hypothetical protein
LCGAPHGSASHAAARTRAGSSRFGRSTRAPG